MNRIFMMLMVVAFATFSIFFAAPAQAQATRTWVSGVGDDANPCSRTAPCKTFAGAISKTAAGGEINCLDPGGFGAVTITKSLTIDCDNTEGGALASLSAITVNATATDVVRLRGLDIFGVSGATYGIRFLAGAALHVDHVRIARFINASSWGILFQPSTAAELFVNDSLITENGNPTVAATAGGGILIQPTGAGRAWAVLNGVKLVKNAQGVRADTGGASTPVRVSVHNSTVNTSAYGGFVAVAAASIASTITVDGSSSNFNGGAGFGAYGATALVRIGRSSATGNGTGTLASNTGIIESYGTNQIVGNANNGTRTIISQD